MRDPFGLDSRFHGNDRKGAGMTHPVSSSTESKALRIGDLEITDWIPVFTRMTHPVSSSTESEALRIGDPEITDWIPVFTGMTERVRE